MSNLTYVYSGEAWDRFRIRYLAKKGFCEICENNGKASPAIFLYQPTPETDKTKAKYSQYNLQALCAECYMSIQTRKAFRTLFSKLVQLALALTAIAIMILILSMLF